MKPLMRDGLPYCSLVCDEVCNFEGRRECRITGKSVTTKLTEGGVLCQPYVGEMRDRLDAIDSKIGNPGCMLLRTFAAEVRGA